MITPDYMRWLPADVSGSIRHLEFVARRKKIGTVIGRHQSPHKGASVEFAEHRAYSRGDDLRHLDWRVLARNDRLFIRQFIEETNLRATVVLDASGSMKYTGTSAHLQDGVALSKFDYARTLAAGLSYSLLAQQDTVGLVTFADRVLGRVRTSNRSSQLRTLLQALHATEPGGDTGLSSVLHEVADRIPSRGLVLLISDLFAPVDELLHALHHFQHRLHEVILFQVMAEEEFTFPFKEVRRFRNLENAVDQLKIDPHSIRAEYQRNVAAHLKTLEESCGRLGMTRVLVTTSKPVSSVIGPFLSRLSGRG